MSTENLDINKDRSDRQHLLLPSASEVSINSDIRGSVIEPQSNQAVDLRCQDQRSNRPEGTGPRAGHSLVHLDNPKEYVVFAQRWYILAIFCLIAFLQSATWNTWGPIQDTASAVLGWTEAQFALLANWGCITFIVSAFFFSWVLHAKGLQVAVLLTGGLLMFGLGIRCIPVPIPMMKWTINTGHIFIGLAGPISMSAATTISATWFPVHERTTATAISSMSGYFGIASSFVIGPQIVGTFTNANTTTTLALSSSNGGNSSYGPVSAHSAEIPQHLKEIRLLMYIEFILTALVFLASVIYYPSTPPIPPTASAVATREDMKSGLCALAKKTSFWIPGLAYAVTTGVFSGWTSQMVAIFNNKIEQTTTGWIGFYTNVAAVFGGIFTGRFADYLGGKMKAILLFLIMASSACLLWTILLVNNYIPFSQACVYVSVVLFGLFLNSAIPIFFEITVEGTFPIGEETTTIFMTWLNNICALLFLFLPMIPSIGSDFGWLNWVMLGSVLLSIPLLLFYKEHYNRLDFDTSHREESGNSNRVASATA